MLDSLYIKNFRNLKEFKIDPLSQVNLITGKNNTGKSTLLEALAIYASRGDFFQMYRFLDYRGENYTQKNDHLKEPKDFVENNIRSLSAMFTDRKPIFLNNVGIQIGSFSKGKTLNLRFLKYTDEDLQYNQGEIVHRRSILAENESNKLEFKIGFEISLNKIKTFVPLDQKSPYHFNLEGLGDLACVAERPRYTLGTKHH